MTQLVQPRLVDGSEGDPGVYLDFRFGRRAMLFDLGGLATLSPRELLRVSHAFVSHAHMDHVAGFDHLLRLRLHRPPPLTVVGPAGFIDQVESRLGAFTWNLLDAQSVDFRLHVLEFAEDRVSAAAEFRARDGFRRRDLEPPGFRVGAVLEEDNLAVEAVALDHGIPSLAFALQEGLRVNVWRSALDELGLAPGPWLDDAKRAARSALPDDHPVAAGQGEVPLGLLRQRVFRISRGQRVVYVTDAADSEANRERIVRLAAEADDLFIETAFLERDRALAEATAHLTARAAGELARAARARRVTGFHQSARYADAPEALEDELEDAAGGPEGGPVVQRVAPRASLGADVPMPGEPAWIGRWRKRGLGREAALARFDGLPGLETCDLMGEWQGFELPTGHPLDGVLEALDWRGKRFEDEERVHPLLFASSSGVAAVDPAHLPVGLALRWPALARSAPARTGFRALRLVLPEARPAARLRMVDFRGQASAAMIYDRLPIIDHFRRIGPGRVLGLMEMRGTPPYFFLLRRNG